MISNICHIPYNLTQTIIRPYPNVQGRRRPQRSEIADKHRRHRGAVRVRHTQAAMVAARGGVSAAPGTAVFWYRVMNADTKLVPVIKLN